jgi:hypothetical protein
MQALQPRTRPSRRSTRSAAAVAALLIALLVAPTGQSVLDRTQQAVADSRLASACLGSNDQYATSEGFGLAIRKARGDSVLFSYGYDGSGFVASWSVDRIDVNCVEAVAEPTSYSPVLPDQPVVPFDASPGYPHFINHTAPGFGQRVTVSLTYEELDFGSGTLVTKQLTLDASLGTDATEVLAYVGSQALADIEEAVATGSAASAASPTGADVTRANPALLADPLGCALRR